MLQLLRSLNYWGWGWVSVIPHGTVPVPKALLGAGPACAAHMVVSLKGRFWPCGSGEGGERWHSFTCLLRGGSRDTCYPSCVPTDGCGGPLSYCHWKGKVSFPRCSSVQMLFPPPLSHALICNRTCLAILCFHSHLPLHQLFSSKVGAKNDPSFPS